MAIIRGIYYHTLLYGLGILSSLTFIILLRMKPHSPLIEKYGSFICPLLLKAAGVKLSVNGEQHIATVEDQSYIIISNHVTTLDIPIHMVALNDYDINYIYSSKTVLNIPIIGKIIKMIFDKFGWFGINPDNIFSLKGCVDQISRLSHQRKLRIAICPEGDRSKQGEINEFKNGAFYLAAFLNMPIIPILMQGVSRIHTVRTLPVYANQVGIDILPPIYPEKIKADLSNLHQVTKKLKADITELYTSVPNLNTNHQAYTLWKATQPELQ